MSIRSHAAGCAVAAGLMAGISAPAARPISGAVGIAAADLLRIDAVAVDRSGFPVLDLKPDEFEVWINGYRIPIETLTSVTAQNTDRARTIVLLLDDLAVGPVVAPRIKEIARRFVTRMSIGDSMAIVSLNGDMMESTDNRDRLLRAVDSYHPRGFPVRIEDAGEHVLKTIAALSRQFAEGAEGRKTIVGVGSGWLFDTPIPPPHAMRDLRSEWLDAMRATARANVSLYVIDPAGVGRAPVTTGSSGFARETGGHAFVNTNDFNGAVDRIWREAGNYYLIRVANPPVGRKADLREVDVRVLRRGVIVHARRGIPP